MALEPTDAVYYEYEDMDYIPKYDCPEEMLNVHGDISIDTTQPYCDSSHDTLLCWPATYVGDYAEVPCPLEFEGLPLQPGIASKQCIDNMTWGKADYSACLPLNPTRLGVEEICHIVSAGLLLIVLIIYCLGKECFLLRTIQLQLLISYFIQSCLFIAIEVAVMSLDTSEDDEVFEMSCKVLSASFHYFTMTNFFWMFVETNYLYLLVLHPDKVGKLSGWIFAFIAWGIPQVPLIVWVFLSLTLKSTSCWLPEEDVYRYIEYVLSIPVYIILVLMLILLIITACALIMRDADSKIENPKSLDDVTVDVQKSLAAAFIVFFLMGMLYTIILLPIAWLFISESLFRRLLSIGYGVKGALLAVLYFIFNTWIPPAIWRKCRKHKDLEVSDSEEDTKPPYLGTVV